MAAATARSVAAAFVDRAMRCKLQARGTTDSMALYNCPKLLFVVVNCLIVSFLLLGLLDCCCGCLDCFPLAMAGNYLLPAKMAL